MNTLTLAIIDGDLEIRQDELISITDAELMEFGISRKKLSRVFAEGVEMMKNYTPSDRVRPLAYETRSGKWEVHIVGYSPLSDPLMQGPMKGMAS